MLVLAARATPRPRVTRRDLELAAVGLGSWFAFYQAGPALLAHDTSSQRGWGIVTLIMLGIAVAAVATSVARGRHFAWLAGIPLVAVAVRPLDHTTLVLVLAAVALALLTALGRSTRIARSSPTLPG
jgi:hypothetical protein